MEAEFMVYYVILTTWLFPDEDRSFEYIELVQCLAFSLSCIKPTLASVSGRSFETGVFPYSYLVLAYLPIYWRSGK